MKKIKISTVPLFFLMMERLVEKLVAWSLSIGVVVPEVRGATWGMKKIKGGGQMFTEAGVRELFHSRIALVER